MNPTRNAIWLTSCRLIGDVLNLLLFIVISRQLGPAGAGAYSYGFAVATFAFVIACLGIEEYGLRHYVRLDDQHRPAFLGELLGTQVYMVVIAVIAIAVYMAATGPSVETLIIVAALSCYQIVGALTRTLFIPAMAQQRMLEPALAELISRVIALITAGSAVGVSHVPLSSGVVGFTIAAVVWLALGVRSVRRHAPAVRVAVTSAGMRRIVTALWSFALLEVFAQLFTRIGVISLSLGVGDAEAGIFATGLRLIEVALMPLSFLGVAWYPRLSRLYTTDRAAFRHTAGDLSWLLVLGGVALAWGLYYVAPLLLVPVLGQRFAGAEPFIQLMALLALVQAVEVGLGRVMLAADRQTPAAAFIACAAVVSVILNAVLVPRFGIRGTIYTAVVAYVLVDVLCIGSLKSLLGGGALLRLFSAALLSLAAGAGTAAVVGSVGLPNWVQAVASGVAMVLVAAGSYRLHLTSSGHRTVPWPHLTERH